MTSLIFWKDIVFPVVILVVAVLAIVFVINLVLRAIKLDMTIFRIAAFFAIWYFVGPIIYDWLSYHVLTVNYEAIRILYMPIQYVIVELRKLA